MNNKQIKQRLQKATSEPQVKALLKEGASFKMASDSTRHKWQRIADDKIKSFKP